MDTASQILLIIVSATLTLFLVVGIVALIKTIQVMNHLKRITEKAESIADKAEAVGEFFQKTAGPAAITKLVSNIVHAVHDKKESKKENKS
jgi:hypothetical protein